MNKLISACFTIALITISADAQATNQQLDQSRCSLTEANSPNIRSIRLGMSTEQVLALFPGSDDRAEIKSALKSAKVATSYDTTYLYFQPTTYASKNRFAGIDLISLILYKGRVVDFSVAYAGPDSNGPAWRTIDEWVAKLSEAFGLPAAGEWVIGANENPNKTLKCNGIEIEAAIGGGTGSIRVRKPGYEKEVEERMTAGQEKKRREFKP